MKLINQFDLIHELMQGKQIDSIEMLSKIDKNDLLRRLQKTKQGIPKPFKYTTDPIEDNNVAKMSQRDKEKLWEIYERVPKSPSEELPKLLKLKDKYPDVPVIYNHISAAYAYNGQTENYFNFIIETVNKFPDYLFGKIALAEYYLNKGEYSQVPKVLNNKLEIHMHHDPSVKIFHFSEVRGFYSVVSRYYVKANKINRALYCYFILAEVDPNHFAARQLANEIIYREIDELKKRFQERRR